MLCHAVLLLTSQSMMGDQITDGFLHIELKAFWMDEHKGEIK